jgi:hypothetical protein
MAVEVVTAKVVLEVVDTLAVATHRYRVSRILVEPRAQSREASFLELREIARRMVSILSGRLALVSVSAYAVFIAGVANECAVQTGRDFRIAVFPSRDEATLWLRDNQAVSVKSTAPHDPGCNLEGERSR